MKKIIIFCVLFLLECFILTSFVFAQNANYAEQEWHYKVSKPGTSPRYTDPPIGCPSEFEIQAVLGDVDHDGYPEVVFVRCNQVNVLEDIGFDRDLANVIWSYPTDVVDYFLEVPIAEIEDMDQDGLLEIVAPINKGFVVLKPWDKNGTLVEKPEDALLWKYQNTSAPPEHFYHYAIGDVNNDSFSDVISIERMFNHQVRVTAVGGKEHTVIWEYLTSGEATNLIPPTLFDMDNDGHLDVIIQFDNTVEVLKVFPNTNPIRVMNWICLIPKLRVLSEGLSAADLDNNGTPELIVKAAWADVGVVVDARIYILTVRDGQLDVMLDYDHPYNNNFSPNSEAIGDVDNDGKDLEIAVSNQSEAYIINNQGQLLWRTEYSHQYYSNPTLADLDKDGDLELVIVDSAKINGEWVDRLLIFDPVLDPLNPENHVNPVYEAIITSNGSGYGTPVIGDLNGDGLLEIVFNTVENKDNIIGALWSYRANLSLEEPNKVVWQTIQANNHKTNLGEHGRLKPNQNEPKNKSFQRGDVNDDGRLDLSDPISLLNFVYRGGATPGCLDAADFNNDGNLDTKNDTRDTVTLLNYFFLGGPVLPDPFMTCGIDTSTSLGCSRYPLCPGN